MDTSAAAQTQLGHHLYRVDGAADRRWRNRRSKGAPGYDVFESESKEKLEELRIELIERKPLANAKQRMTGWSPFSAA